MSAAVAELSWVVPPVDPGTYEGVHDLVAGVAALRGAVGWVEVPDRDETRAWLDGVVGAGARLLLARDGGAVVGCGYWARMDAAVTRQNAEIRKVMTAEAARGRGIARQVVEALVRDADEAGVEVVSLDSRGNNHAALALYARLGFVTTGRRPDWIAVGDDRFDQVLMHLDLRTRRGAAGLRRHGGRREGPGCS